LTWVVGGKHVFCARALSDVQVTLTYPNGQKLFFDAVKKVHIIGPGITILFADSIKLAFGIIEELKKNFYPAIDPRLFENPKEIMRQMVRHIKFYYAKHRQHDKDRVEFLVFISPSGLYTEFGMWKLVSPSFQLIERKKPFEMLELGSGSALKDYRDIVKKNSQGLYFIDDPDGGLPNAIIPLGKVALEYIFAEALDYQNAGISKAMHITGITHEGIYIKQMPDVPDGAFPDVADSWEALKKVMGENGIKLAECYASA
jgi:hypothetical protein